MSEPKNTLDSAINNPAEDENQSFPKEQPNKKTAQSEKPRELGGRAGPEPTRYGDWENNGIISDF